MINFNDTICAPATSVGTGAISIIRISGPAALSITDDVVAFAHSSASSSSGYRLKRGSIGDIDDVVVGIFRSPHSYTGDDSTEIYCHASSYIVGQILSRLCDAGCRMAVPGEFTRRAFLAGKMDLAQAEAVADVISSTSAMQHRVAMNQLRGGYSKELSEIRARLLHLATLLELELDFSEEEVEFADRSELRRLLDEAISHCTRLADSFRIGNAVKNGVPVAIVGAPNSGKSTLLNALVGDDRAIVSDVPGTTRDTVEETMVLGGVLFRFIDTAGIRSSSDTVERLGIERTFRKISEAEIVLGVMDISGSDSPSASEELLSEAIRHSAESLLSRVDLKTRKVILLANKCDICSDNKNVAILNNIVSSSDYKSDNIILLEISAKSGLGLDILRNSLVSMAGPASLSDTLVTNARHAAALRSAAASLVAVRSGLGLRAPEASLSATSSDSVCGAGLDLPALDTSSCADCASVTSSASASDFVCKNDSMSSYDCSSIPISPSVHRPELLQPIPTDLLAEDLRAAIDSLGTITGEITTDEVLGEIFSKFCIGK